MIKLIISDFFGVVGDEDGPVFFKKYVDPSRAQELTAKYFHPADRGEITFMKVVKNIARDYSFSEEFVRKELCYTPEPHKEIINAYQELKMKGYALALLSDASDFLVEFLSKRYGTEDLFERSFISYATKVKKPDPQAFFNVLEAFNVKPQESLFIDDNAKNIAAAKALGMGGLLYEGSKSANELLRIIKEK